MNCCREAVAPSRTRVVLTLLVVGTATFVVLFFGDASFFRIEFRHSIRVASSSEYRRWDQCRHYTLGMIFVVGLEG